MAEQEMAITGPQMHGTQFDQKTTVFPHRDPNDNRDIRIPRRAFEMRDVETVKGPDINNPKDGNKIVSPENLHTDPVVNKVNPDEVKVEPAKVEVKEAPKETPTPVVIPVKVEDKTNEQRNLS